MCKKNITKWKRNQKFKDFIEDFRSYYLMWGKIQKVKIRKIQEQKKGRIMLLSKCTLCDSKKSKLIKNQEASRLLSSLRIKTPLSKISLVGPVLF